MTGSEPLAFLKGLPEETRIKVQKALKKGHSAEGAPLITLPWPPSSSGFLLHRVCPKGRREVKLLETLRGLSRPS